MRVDSLIEPACRGEKPTIQLTDKTGRVVDASSPLHGIIEVSVLAMPRVTQFPVE